MINTVVITGAGRGIGLELVKTFLRFGNHKVIAIARNTSNINEIRNDLLTVINADLVKDYPLIINQISALNSPIQLLINNAALVLNKPIESLIDTDLNEIMEINFYTPFKLIRDLKPYMPPSAHIINISSMSGFQGSKKVRGLSLYSASKAALASLTESVAEEYRASNVFCNCIALGSVNTDMINQSIPGFKPNIEASQLADFLYNFATTGHKVCNGQIIPITLDNL